MGGGMAIASAATYPDHFAAVASFHGGNLATDAPSSPHLLAPKLKAEVYVAGADNDGSYPPAMAQRLETALTKAGVSYVAEIYPGAAHGWMVPDFPVYDQLSAKLGWKSILALFKREFTWMTRHFWRLVADSEFPLRSRTVADTGKTRIR
jgi:carboxymethylenebutenolidase